MKKKLKFLSAFLLFYIIFLNACSAQETVTAELAHEFSIKVGQSAKVTSEDLIITFNEVTGDSRCPKNVNCIWAGEVKAKITIDYRGQESSVILIEPGLSDKAEYDFSGYTLVYHIDPYPIAGDEISSDEYRLTIKITK